MLAGTESDLVSSEIEQPLLKILDRLTSSLHQTGTKIHARSQMREKQRVNQWLSRARQIFALGVLFATLLLLNLPILGQDQLQTTTTGTVVSYNKNSLIVKSENGQYTVFVFDRNTVKPDTLAAGSGVRVVSTQTSDHDIRVAVLVTSAERSAPASTQPEVVPASVRSLEHSIERNARKFHFGVQGGMALNPELVDIGVHARFGPFFTRNVQFRPSVDFSYGEITKLFALSADVIYNLSTTPGARRSFYFGGGPQFNFVEQSASGHGVDFSEFHYSNALDILLGVRFRNGAFTEMKTSVYASPAPIFRLIAGYTF